MKSNKNIIVIAIVIIAVLGILLFLGGSSKKQYSWQANLDTTDVEPYGLKVFKNTLKNKYPEFSSFKSQTIFNLYKETEKLDYYAVGNYLNYKSTEIDSLLSFVTKGNNIFLSFGYISDTVLLKFGIPISELNSTTNMTSKINVNFTHPKLKTKNGIPVSFHESYDKTTEHGWLYFDPVTDYDDEMEDDVAEDYYGSDEYDYEEDQNDPITIDSLDEERNKNVEIYLDGTFWYGNDFLMDVEPIKTIADVAYFDTSNQVICKRYQVGEGFVYIMLNPILLTNFYCSNDTTRQISTSILSHFNADKCILDIEATGFKMGSFSLDASNTPLRYVLSKKWFKIGFYSLLFSVLVFVVLGSYRRQRPMPVFSIPENKSIEQIKNIAAVLYHDKDVRKLETYLKNAYQFWRTENIDKLKLLETTEEELLSRCDFLARRDMWEVNQTKEFQIKFNQLKIVYGK